MPLNWNDNLSVGIREIDLQHQELIEIINQLELAVITYQQAKALGEVLPRLNAYVLFHFTTEEALMTPAISQVHVEKHRLQHQEFTARVAALRAQPLTTIDLSEFVDYLKRWLVEHIMKTDRELGQQICAQQKYPPA
jgi:hemerythrin